jgi:hypothetical protein
MSTSPDSIRSTTCGEPSLIFGISSTGTPIRRIARAVPPVARISKPESCSDTAISDAAALSPSVTLMKAAPDDGIAAPAAACALPNAAG